MGAATVNASCREDWISDRRITTGDRYTAAESSEPVLTKQQFFASIFELADMWCVSLDPKEYESFIVMLDAWCGAEYRGEIAAKRVLEQAAALAEADEEADEEAVVPLHSRHCHWSQERQRQEAKDQQESVEAEAERLKAERAMEAQERALMRREDIETVRLQEAIYDSHVQKFNAHSTVHKAAWSVRKLLVEANSPRSPRPRIRIRRDGKRASPPATWSPVSSPGLGGRSTGASPWGSPLGTPVLSSALDLLQQKTKGNQKAVFMPLVPLPNLEPLGGREDGLPPGRPALSPPFEAPS